VLRNSQTLEVQILGILMKLFGIDKPRRVARRVKRQFQAITPIGAILMYHRVAELDADPWHLSITPHHFAEHLEVLRKYECVMSLQDMARTHQEKSLPRGAVAVTFDDGYADNLYNAQPLLKRYNIPATFFLSSGCIGREREFWWDELERLLLQPGVIPETLRLIINGDTHEWNLGAAAYYSATDYQRDRYTYASKAMPGSRLTLYYTLWQLLKPLPDGEQYKVLDSLKAWAGAEPQACSTHRTLMSEEVRSLGQGELFEIGAHTVTHPFLSSHSVAFQQNEIHQSKAYLEDLIGQSVNSFSYPFGNYTAETVFIVQNAGFSCACSTFQDVVWRRSNCFQLPRFEVHNWDGETFEEHLIAWLYG